MATVEFVELESEILSAAPTCPTTTIIRSLRNATRNLCEKALCYRYDVGNIVVPAGINTVSLDVPPYTVLHKPIALSLDSYPLYPASPLLLDEEDRLWRTRTGRPQYFYRSSEDMNDIKLSPIPTVTYATVGLRGEIAVKPSRTATVIEEIFLDQYQDIIVDGALADVLSVASAPWYNPPVAAFHLQKFEDGCLEAKARGQGDDFAKPFKVKYGGL